MAGEVVRIPFGPDREVEFPLAPNWELAGVCEPRVVTPCSDVANEARRAIAKPHGSPPLEQVARRATKVVVVVDDVSRPTPVHQFFRPVMESVESAGVKPEQITVLTALGVHRPMSDDEIAAKIGSWGAARYTCVNHDSAPGEHLVRLGKTTRGSEVWVNRLVAEADLVISMGCIEPHTIAGFGGGYKNIFPGVAGKVTIAANHALNTTPSTFNMVGSRPETNPMRCDLEECGRMLNSTVFVVNAILDGKLRVVEIAAGDAVAAHREGIRTSERIFGVEIDAPADILITGSAPMDIDLRQGLKALANTIRAVRRGGMMINFITAAQGLGDSPLPTKNLYVGKRTVRALSYALLPLIGKFTFGLREEDLYFIYFALQAFQRNDIYFYSPNVPPEFTKKIPFFEIHASIDALSARTHAAARGRARVLVFPKGGVTYPILKG